MFLAPTFLTVQVTSTVFYDYTQTSLGPNDIKALVIQALQTYNDKELQVFDTTLRYSKLGGAIDNASPAINSNETDLSLIAPLNIMNLANNSTQTISFYNPIRTINGITSDNFVYNNSQSRIISKDDGNLYITNTLTGDEDEAIIIKTIGTVDFVNGIVNIAPTVFGQIFGEGINLYAIPANKDIQVVQNTLMNIDFNHVNINVIPQVKK
jgi:hypothetical protein